MTHLHKPNYWWTFIRAHIFESQLCLSRSEWLEIPALSSSSNWFKSSARVIYISIKISFFCFTSLSCPLGPAIETSSTFYESQIDLKITRARDELSSLLCVILKRSMWAQLAGWRALAEHWRRRSIFSLLCSSYNLNRASMTTAECRKKRIFFSLS